MFRVQLRIIFLGFLIAAGQALDYIFLVPEEGPVPCEEREDKFLDKFFDLSNIYFTQIDDETVCLQGYAELIREIDYSLHLHLQVQRYNSGRWLETAYHTDRADVCTTLFDKNEIWYDFIKELENSSKICPPKIGTRYYFHDKKISTVLNDLPPAMDGTYRAVLKLYVAEKLFFCMNVEGDLTRKSENNKMMG